MKLRNLALALALAAPFTAQFGVAQDAKKTDEKPAKEAQDPVCGMMVETATAPKTEYKGKTYYFCSIDEKKEFDKAPSTYIKLDKKDTTKK
ncbi:MAG TPA: YHS domain-containing protein [Bryobacteraceae bacterium]|jgi:YHS domain-containing protein|nr:YHS domain-containing protein [Bryobacteraceae bacterium]